MPRGLPKDLQAGSLTLITHPKDRPVGGGLPCQSNPLKREKKVMGGMSKLIERIVLLFVETFFLSKPGFLEFAMHPKLPLNSRCLIYKLQKTE